MNKGGILILWRDSGRHTLGNNESIWKVTEFRFVSIVVQEASKCVRNSNIGYLKVSNQFAELEVT